MILRAIILDSGVFLAKAFTEQYTKEAIALLARIESEVGTIHAPILLHYEIVSVIRLAVYNNRIGAEKASALRTELLDIPLQLHFDRRLVERAYDLAQDFKLPRTYDAQYLALADRLGCEFWTGDERLFNSVRAAFSNIRWLGEYE